MKKLIIFATILIPVVICVFMFIPSGLTVNSVRVPDRITEAFKEEIQATVFSDLCRKYSVTDTTDFWNKKFPEGKAGDILAQRAREKAIEYTIKLQLCMENVDYDTILKNFENENQRLKEALKNGEVIYGNTQYSLTGYLSYVLSEHEKNYKAQYVFTDDELLKIYNEHKESYKLDDIVTVKRFSFPFYENGQFNEDKYYKQKEKAEAFVKAVDFTVAATYTFTPTDSKAFPNTYNYAMSMELGEVSGLICDEASFEIIYCVKREPGGYMKFENVKQDIVRIAEAERFNTEVENALKNAKISSH